MRSDGGLGQGFLAVIALGEAMNVSSFWSDAIYDWRIWRRTSSSATCLRPWYMGLEK